MVPRKTALIVLPVTSSNDSSPEGERDSHTHTPEDVTNHSPVLPFWALGKLKE